MSFVPESPPPPALPPAPRRRTGLIVIGAVVVGILAGGAVYGMTASNGDATTPTVASVAPASAPAVPDDKAPANPDDAAVDSMAPLPTARPKLVEPVAGEIGEEPASVADLQTAPPDDGKDPKVTGPASSSTQSDVADPGVSNLKPDRATALPNGVALPPLAAPEPVLDVIRAGNIIARSPYKWGGGHGRFKDNGYDCSGSVSYALYYAGLIDGPHVSGDLMAYGKPGPGEWISIYASPTHVYMEVAGIRFDTSGQTVTGSRWQNDLRNNAGMEVRHPEGL